MEPKQITQDEITRLANTFWDKLIQEALIIHGTAKDLGWHWGNEDGAAKKFKYNDVKIYFSMGHHWDYNEPKHKWYGVYLLVESSKKFKDGFGEKTNTIWEEEESGKTLGEAIRVLKANFMEANVMKYILEGKGTPYDQG